MPSDLSTQTCVIIVWTVSSSRQKGFVCRMASLLAKPGMKERILETADRLFYLQGIRAIGVDTIAAEVGISKRTLYNHFPSKDALISAYLGRRFVTPGASDKPPAEQILSTFDRDRKSTRLNSSHSQIS